MTLLIGVSPSMGSPYGIGVARDGAELAPIDDDNLQEVVVLTSFIDSASHTLIDIDIKMGRNKTIKQSILKELQDYCIAVGFDDV